jgi:hypothetical protein
VVECGSIHPAPVNSVNLAEDSGDGAEEYDEINLSGLWSNRVHPFSESL